MTSKSMYKSFVKILNKDKLNGRADTPWRAHFGLDNEVNLCGELYINYR